MKTKQPSFKMISCTENPVETLFSCWVQSRPTQYPKIFEWLLKHRPDSGGVVTVKDILFLMECEGRDRSFGNEPIISRKDVDDVFKNVVAMSIPVTESVHFTWGFTNLPIEWREQAVRKRQWGFWLTSMREFGMDDFVTDGRWSPPPEDSVPPEAMKFLVDFMQQVEKAYVKLKELGAPQEIARKVIPLCASHNGTMFSNMRTLLDTLASRSCWIAQLDIWAPVLVDMVTELKKVHPLLGMLVSPPCFDRFKDDYKGCKYKLINENRLTGKDPYAPCPLYVTNELASPPTREMAATLRIAGIQGDLTAWIELMREAKVGGAYITQGQRLLPIWKDVWNRDPFSGKLL